MKLCGAQVSIQALSTEPYCQARLSSLKVETSSVLILLEIPSTNVEGHDSVSNNNLDAFFYYNVHLLSFAQIFLNSTQSIGLVKHFLLIFNAINYLHLHIYIFSLLWVRVSRYFIDIGRYERMQSRLFISKLGFVSTPRYASRDRSTVNWVSSKRLCNLLQFKEPSNPSSRLQTYAIHNATH